nr:ribonuclease H-like domain-containing protein [Tanacetum cinerariifolium]
MSYKDSLSYSSNTTYYASSNSKTGKIDFDKKESARFNKKKVRCYKCQQKGHFAKECKAKEGNDKQRYSSLKIKEIGKKEEDSKALIIVDTLVDWTDHDDESAKVITAKEFGMIAGCDSEDAIKEGAAKIYNLITGANSKEANTTGDAGEFAIMGVTSEDDSAFSVFTTNSEDVEGRPIFYRFAKTDSMKVVPLPLSGDYTSLSDHSDLDESQMSYGTKSSTSSDSKSVSNDFVSCDDNDKSLEDCDFYEKQMVNKTIGIGVGLVHSRNKVNHPNQFVPQALLFRTGMVTIPPTRPQLVPTGKPKVFTPVPAGRQNRPCPVSTDRGYTPSVVLGNHIEKVYNGYPRIIVDLIHLHTDDNMANLLIKAFDGPSALHGPGGLILMTKCSYCLSVSTAGPPGTFAVPLGTSAVPPGTSTVPPGTSDVPLGTSVVPTGASTAPAGSLNVPTDVPSSAAPAGVSSKGKSLMVEEDILVKSRIFKHMEEDRLGEEAAKRLHDEEMAQMERQRTEVQRKRQQDFLDSAMYYNEADWLNIRAQIRKVQSNSQIQAFSRTLKRSGLVLEEPSSKRQQSIETPISSVPEVPHSPAISSPPSSRTRRKSLGRNHILKPKSTLLKLDLDADAQTFIKVVVNEDSDDDVWSAVIGGKGSCVWQHQNLWEIRSWRLYTLSNVHVLETMSGEVLSMFIDVFDPLSVKLMKRMLMHKLEIDLDVVGNDMTTAEQLIQFIKNQLATAQASSV